MGGEQYIAVLAGVGGSHGGHFARIDYVNEGRVLAWKLGGTATMPSVQKRPAQQVEAPPIEASAETIARGQSLYSRCCLFCHGVGAESSGLHPDLHYSNREVHEQWNSIVLGGARQEKGMASFADRLSEADAEAIHAYVINRALREPDISERVARWLGRYVCVPAPWLAD